MQEAGEQDTCRICSAPAEPGQPLFHPCKCSGTIRYIHQDCLTTWLAHSKKKTCDVCKHSYSFTKVYAADMPPSLPPLLLVQRLIQQLFFGILFGVRAIVVGIIWLAVLPWATVWTWRMYFTVGESTAWWISNRVKPITDESPPLYNKLPLDSSLPPSHSLIARVTSHPLWITLSADIFTGQIIASLVVLTFIAIFLLREWISQNARPGVFEDEEIPQEEDVPAHVEPEAPQAAEQQQPRQVLDPERLAHQQLDAVRALNEIRARHRVDMVVDPTVDKDRNNDFLLDPGQPARSRRRVDKSVSSDEEYRSFTPELRRIKRRHMSYRKQISRASDVQRKSITAVNTPSSSSTPLPIAEGSVPQRDFDFTFKSDATLGGIARRSVSEPRPLSFSSGSTLFGQDNSESSEISQSNILPPSLTSGFLSSPPSKVLRPPLPTTISISEHSSPFHVSPSKTPLSSPSLATYHAPEELDTEAGPSRKQEYFDEDQKDAGVQLDDDSNEEISELVGSSAAYSSQEDDNAESYDQYFVEVPEYGSEKEDSDETASEGDESTINSDDGRRPRDWQVDTRGEGDNEEHDEDEEEDEDDYDDYDDDEQGEGGIFDGPNWDDIEDGDNEVGNARPQPREGAGQVAPGDGQAQQEENPDAPVAAELNEEMEGNVEDDMEGALEAIGMRGPVYGVIQNAALMTFVLDTALGLGIWIPFTIGKSVALLSLDPKRFLEILHLPIRAMRIITDPIVDICVYFVVHFWLPAAKRTVRRVIHAFTFLALTLVGLVFGQERKESLTMFSSEVYFKVQDWPQFFVSRHVPPANVSDSASGTSSPLLIYLLDHLGPTEPYFATLGMKLRILGAQAKEYGIKLQATWIRLALGHGPTEKAFAIILGYACFGLLLSLYLNILTVGNARSAGRAVRNAVRQQLLVVKVAAFIFIELVTFPLGCGIVLDLSTVWLFPEANLQSRTAFFLQAPLTAMFYHWIAGTIFMYTFAVLLSGCRSVMRSGAMWFIKDPQDQNSHPIRDILDRPTLTQLRKIFVSGVMYSFVVVCVVSSVAGLLLLGSKSIMPFRWKNREPLSNIPVDLLFLHLVLPYTMHYFRPKRGIKSLTTIIWKYLSSKLRLSSYFFGGRYPNEEYTSKHLTFNLSQSSSPIVDSDAIRDGAFRRVPATDNLALPRDMRATAAVNEDGEPLDDAAKELITMQNSEAEKAKRNIQEDYIVVYIPPHFRYRIICFIALFWVFSAISLGVLIALPIQLGRSFFAIFTNRIIHDGYSIIIGFYLIWACYLVGVAIDRLDKRRQRTNPDGRRADLHMLILKRGLLWIAKTLYMVAFIGVVIPILVAFVVDLYIVLPIRFSLDPGMMPRVRVIDTWALGLLYTKIALHAVRIQPANQITRGLQRVMANGWTRPDPITATKEFIAPLTGGLLGMILFPGAVFRAAQFFFPVVDLDDKFIFMVVYPGIFLFAGLIRSTMVFYDLISSWSQSIRDKEFLVELRLRNHEPDKINALNGEGDES